MTPNGAQVPVPVSVRAAALGNSLTITPSSAECGTNAICSGQNGTASVTLLGPQGAGRAVRFDVVGTAYAIVTNNPAQPFASTLTVVSDATGVASVIIQANVNAPTQFAQLRVTDITSGQQVTGNFIIQQITDGAEILTVVPGEAKITGPAKGICSTGFATDYYIYGGTPPYRVTSSFPNAITLLSSTVNANGGFFRAITNGSCVDPLTFSILDADGPPDDGDPDQRRGNDGRAGGAADKAECGSDRSRRLRLHRQVDSRIPRLRGLRRHAPLQRQTVQRHSIAVNHCRERRFRTDQRPADRQRKDLDRVPRFRHAATDCHRDDRLQVAATPSRP